MSPTNGAEQVNEIDTARYLELGLHTVAATVWLQEADARQVSESGPHDRVPHTQATGIAPWTACIWDCTLCNCCWVNLAKLL